VSKRAFDLIFSSVVLIILGPILLLISLLIIADSRGGPLYVQPRVGQWNRDFYVIKFRTMKIGAEKKGQ